MEVGGWPLQMWLQVVDDCSDSTTIVAGNGAFKEVHLREWPDGESYLNQPSVAVSIMKLFIQIINDEMRPKK